MQPYFFPYIGYFQAIIGVDKYIIYDNLNFIKEAWMNRNGYLLKKWQSLLFYRTLKKKSSYKKIYEIELIESNNWRKKILHSIFLNYKKAKYFDEVYPLIEFVVNYPTSKLTELNYLSITQVCKYLRVTTAIEIGSEKYVDLESKLERDVLDKNDFPGISITNLERKTLRVLSICKNENADTFINSIGGRSLYSKQEFKKNGISLYFVNTNSDLIYNQLSKTFIPGLSIIDLIMNCGKEGSISYLNKYSLV